MTAINSFDGEYAWLSNFWPCSVCIDMRAYPSVEHAFVAHKAADGLNAAQYKRLVAMTAGEAKRYGRSLRLHPQWDTLRLEVMNLALRAKFAIPELRAKLLATYGRELIEGNFWRDRYWGVYLGAGENHLGRLLMEIREELHSSALAPSKP